MVARIGGAETSMARADADEADAGRSQAPHGFLRRAQPEVALP